MTAVGVSVLLSMVVLYLLQGWVCGDDEECPPWHFTPANATEPCCGCSLPAISFVYCSERSGLVDVNLFMTAKNSSFVFGEVTFQLDRSKHMFHRSATFTELPPKYSDLEGFFCNSSNRRGFLCGRCKEGCGIAIYTYYGLPCECDCSNYGIPLFLLLEIGCSTAFFLVLVVLNFSANSSKWITVILYIQAVVHVISSDPRWYTALARSGHWVPIALHTLFGVWNMDFLRLVVPRFCVSERMSVLGAISTGYISAFWPLVLVVLTSLAMHLHKHNFKIVVYPWNIISCGFIGCRLAGTNLIHTFATFFLLSHLKMVYISVFLFTPYYVHHLNREGQHLAIHLSSPDPYVNYFSIDHGIYAILGIMVFVLIGMLLPVVLIFYSTRCGTWLGDRLQSGRVRNAVKTFVEAMNGSYKDGSDGTRDFRALPGVMLLLRSALTLFSSLKDHRGFQEENIVIYAALILLALAAFSGLCRPFKAARHNLYDVLIYCLAAVMCFHFVAILSVPEFKYIMLYSLTVLAFLPLLVVVAVLIESHIMKQHTSTNISVCPKYLCTC